MADPNQKLFSQIADLGRNMNSLTEALKKNTSVTEASNAAIDKGERKEKESATGSVKANTDKARTDKATEDQLKNISKMLVALLGEKSAIKPNKGEVPKKEAENKPSKNKEPQQEKKSTESNKKDFDKVNPKPSKDIVNEKKSREVSPAKEVQSKVGLEKKSKAEAPEKEISKTSEEKKGPGIFSKIGKGAENTAFNVAGKVAGNFGVGGALAKTGLGVLKKSIDKKRDREKLDELNKGDGKTSNSKESDSKKLSLFDKLSKKKEADKDLAETKKLDKKGSDILSSDKSLKTSAKNEIQEGDKGNKSLLNKIGLGKKNKPADTEKPLQEKKDTNLLSKVGRGAENTAFNLAGKVAGNYGVAGALAKTGLGTLKKSIDNNGKSKEGEALKSESKAELGKKKESVNPTETPSMVNNVKKLTPVVKKETKQTEPARETKPAESKALSAPPTNSTTPSKGTMQKSQESAKNDASSIGSPADIQELKDALNRIASILQGPLTVSSIDQPYRPDSRRI